MLLLFLVCCPVSNQVLGLFAETAYARREMAGTLEGQAFGAVVDFVNAFLLLSPDLLSALAGRNAVVGHLQVEVEVGVEREDCAVKGCLFARGLIGRLHDNQTETGRRYQKWMLYTDGGVNENQHLRREEKSRCVVGRRFQFQNKEVRIIALGSKEGLMRQGEDEAQGIRKRVRL